MYETCGLHVLVRSIDRSRFSEAKSFSGIREVTGIFMDPEGSLSCSQQLPTFLSRVKLIQPMPLNPVYLRLISVLSFV